MAPWPCMKPACSNFVPPPTLHLLGHRYLHTQSLLALLLFSQGLADGLEILGLGLHQLLNALLRCIELYQDGVAVSQSAVPSRDHRQNLTLLIS